MRRIPNGTYTFEKEDHERHEPEIRCKGRSGSQMANQAGTRKPQAETAATRLLWAAGYFVDEDYYLPEVKVEGTSEASSWPGVCHVTAASFGARG